MQCRTLGRTGLEIPRLILGCGAFGGIGSDPRFFGKGEDEPAAFALMDRAWDLGITAFDTADAYGGGRSEETIGRWLDAKGSAVRDRLILSSKVGNPMGDSTDVGGLSAGRIKRQLSSSLQRLGTDYLDMYLTHEPDPDTPVEQSVAALDDLVRGGKIRAFGTSNVDVRLLRDALSASTDGSGRVEWVQNNYSLLERGQEVDILPLCEERGLGFTPFSPLAGGWLTGKYSALGGYPSGSRMTLRPEPYRELEHERTLTGLRKLRDAAAVRGVSMAALAMAWALSHPAVTGIVIGPRRPQHLDDAMAALEVELDSEARRQIAALFE